LGVARVYDMVMTHKLDADDFFIHRVQQHCAERGLNFFLIEPLWVSAFAEKFARGEVWAQVLLNMHSEHHQPEDPFHKLVLLAASLKTRVIDPPEVALPAFNKALLHPRLTAAGFATPPSVIVPRASVPGFQLAAEDQARLGSPFVIKPAMGYGRKGVILNATSMADLERSVADWPDSHYLLQKLVIPRWLLGLPAYFRVYYVFGSTWIAWWNCFTDRYRLASQIEVEQFNLMPLHDLVRSLADLTGMKFFSTEVAQEESGEFVLIDYVNDQCHLLTQTASPSNGVPDELVARIAARLVEAAHEWIRA
jgi:hypothetical protein